MHWSLLLLVCTASMASAARSSIPLWLTKELSMLRSEAQANVQSSQRILDRLENSIMRFTYSTEFQTNYDLPDQGSYPRSCKDILQQGKVNGGWNTIDPDGDLGPMKPFMVKCKMERNQLVTEFGFSYKQWTQKFSGPQDCFNHQTFGVPGTVDYCGASKMEIPYKLTRQQMRAAIRVSGNCSQKIEWNCHANSLLYLKPDIGQMLAYGRSLQNYNYFTQGVCECGITGQCRHREKLCNCGADTTEAWHRDSIVIQNESYLPIMDIVMGDLAGSRDKAQIHVSTVTCWA